MTWEPQTVRIIEDERIGLTGYLVIDTLVAGRSCGGVRLVADVTLKEVKALARAMTLKYGFLNDHTIGGAKAGIQIPEDCPAGKKRDILRSFGRSIAPILKSETYIPWTDMNAGPDDIAAILEAAGVVPGRMPDSSHPTALSVLGSIRAACRFSGMDPSGITVAIEGLGNVGTHLAEELSRFGTRIVAVSTHLEARYTEEGFDLQDLNRRYERIDHKTLLELDVDVLVPAARPWTINEDNAERIRAKIVAPAANRPMTPAAVEILQGRGVLLVPDFVANLGGVYGSRLQGRMSKERIRSLFLGPYAEMVFTLLRRAQEAGLSPRELAERIAEENLARIRESEAKSTSGARRLLRKTALSLLDGPLTPNRLVDSLLYRWAQRDLSSKVK